RRRPLVPNSAPAGRAGLRRRCRADGGGSAVFASRRDQRPAYLGRVAAEREALLEGIVRRSPCEVQCQREPVRDVCWSVWIDVQGQVVVGGGSNQCPELAQVPALNQRRANDGPWTQRVHCSSGKDTYFRSCATRASDAHMPFAISKGRPRVPQTSISD